MSNTENIDLSNKEDGAKSKTLSLKQIMGISALGIGFAAFAGPLAGNFIFETLRTSGASDEISDDLRTKIGIEIAKRILERPAALPFKNSEEISFNVNSQEGANGESLVNAVLIEDFSYSCPLFQIQIDHDFKTLPIDINVSHVVCPDEYDYAYSLSPDLPEALKDAISAELGEELKNRPSYLPLKPLNSDGPASKYNLDVPTAEGKEGYSSVEAKFAGDFNNCSIFNVDIDHKKKDVAIILGRVMVCPSP